MLAGVIGRRTLASTLHMTERVLRSETEFLKSQGLIDIDSSGMRVSESGQRLVQEMEPMIKQLFGLAELEAELERRCGLKKVVIVPGDSDRSPIVKKELGRAGAALLRQVVSGEEVIAVTGGSTMAEMANGLTASSRFKRCCFVPARGGLGETVELQANTIAATMAKRTGGHYRLLHVPDHLGEEAYHSLIQEPNIRELLEEIRKAKIVVHGIGDAMAMAARRKVDQATIESLKREGALAEAFGYYFDRNGHVVHKVPTVGLQLEDIRRTDCVIAIAGGTSKGEAIAAVLRHGHEHMLVTDEAAAEQLLEHL